MWVDIRVPREQAGAAVQWAADRAWQAIGRVHVDLNPPASGPEAEVTFSVSTGSALMGVSAERTIADELRELGVSVLAARTRTWERRP